MPRLASFITCCILLILAGCGEERRQAIEGTVSLDGKPLAAGYIQFRPAESTQGPTAGAEIREGRFKIDGKKGTFSGKFRVEITASRRTNRKVLDDTSGQMVDVSEQYIPAKYNRQSKLETEISTDGPKQFAFDLKTNGE